MGESFLRFAFAALALAACQPEKPTPTGDLPPVEGPVRLEIPRPPVTPPETVALRELRVDFKGSFEPGRRVSWTVAEARERIEHLERLARSQGQDFAALAKRFSDAPISSAKGGNLGVIERGRLHPDLEAAAFALEIGQISAPVLTPRGFYLLQRTEPTEVQLAEIAIVYTGSAATPRVARGREAARALAQEIRSRLALLPPSELPNRIREESQAHSDHPLAARGGFHRIMERGAERSVPREVVSALEVGGLSEILETARGFHFFASLPVRRVCGRIAKFRSEEAAEEGLELLRASKLDFAALADANPAGLGERAGGLLEPFGRGELPAEVEAIAFGLLNGEVSHPIMTAEAVYLFKRVP